MFIADISDVHIGDESSRMALGKVFNPNGAYSKLKDQIFKFTGNAPLDYLILDGDILDFSINPIDDSIRTARPFFMQLQRDNIAKQIVYIPGNHDKQIWDGIQWNTSIIGSMLKFANPGSFRRIQPGIIDLAANSEIELPGVTKGSDGNYGDVFMKGLFQSADNSVPISVVYPNLYIKRSSDTILVTHGHMFEMAWVLFSELFQGISPVPDTIDLKNLEELNVPITSLICTGVGSGGAVSELFYMIEKESYKNETATLKKTLDTVIPRLEKIIELPWYLESLDNIGLNALRKYAFSAAMKAKDSRGNADFLKGEKDLKRFFTYFYATLAEMNQYGLGKPDKFLYGHTHIPTPASDPFNLGDALPGVSFYNTGGWLNDSPAELFLIDDGRFQSVTLT